MFCVFCILPLFALLKWLAHLFDKWTGKVVEPPKEPVKAGCPYTATLKFFGLKKGEEVVQIKVE
jgi:hypothetical protein